MARTVSNIVKSVDWEDLLSKVKQCDAACVNTTSVSGVANVTSGISKISQSLSNMKQKWEEILNISKTFEKLQEDWEENQAKNAKVISWISDIQVGEDHEGVRAKLGSRYWDAGQWFLQNPEFKKWKRSHRGQFWLQGSVGTGKTSLTSIVINELVKTYDDRSVAFYYCSRGLAATSNNPTAIFRSLVAQLSCTSDGEEIYQVIKDWYNRDAKRFVTGSRLSLEECENLLVTLMELRGKTAIVIDGIDECTEPMKLLRSLHHIWENYKGLMVFVTSRLDVAVSEIFPKISTVQSDFSKTSDDIREYIKIELQREERRNATVITDELAERMVNILTQRAQGMFRWVELQLDLLISPERRIKYRRDFEDRLKKLEHGSGQEVLDSLRETYDDIYERNTQGPHSRRLAEKSLKWVLCAARPLKVWELGAAVSVDGEDVVTTDLIVDICSNFFIVDPRGFVQLAHLSVREYLEVKSVGGRLIFSPEEAHAEAALTCLLYWKTVSQQHLAGQNEKEEEDDDDLESTYAVSEKQEVATYYFDDPPEGDFKESEEKSFDLDSTVVSIRDDEASNDTDINQPPVNMLDKNTEVTASGVQVAPPDVKSDPDGAIDVPFFYHALDKTPSNIPTVTVTNCDESIKERMNRYLQETDPRLQGSEDMSHAETGMEECDPILEAVDRSHREVEEHRTKREARRARREVEMEEGKERSRSNKVAEEQASQLIRDRAISWKSSNIYQDDKDDLEQKDMNMGSKGDEVEVKEVVLRRTKSNPYDAPTGDYFYLADSYIKIDSALSLKPQRAFRRFQRYASIYWATHCQAAKTLRTDESRALNEPFWEFLGDDGFDPAFRLWATTLLNETKLASLPTINPAPMIFVPATGHDHAILDSEPMYERWQEVVAHVGGIGAQPLMPNVSLIACFYGFTDILQEISEKGEAQTTRNHEGIMGLVLAARNGWNEVLDLPISQDFDLDIPDNEGRTSLHHAALGGYLELARFLLGYPRKPGRRGGKKDKDRKPRANVNARDLGKRTPLHYAAEFQQVEVLKLVLAEDNVDVHVRNHYGLTALGLCPLDSEVAKILRADSRYEKTDEL